MTAEQAGRLYSTMTAAEARRILRRTGLVKSLAAGVLAANRHPNPQLQKGKPVSYELDHAEVRQIVRKQVFKGVKKAAEKARKRAKKAARQDARQAFQKSAATDRLAADMRAEVERLRQKAAILTLQQRFAKSTDPEERQKLADLGEKLTFLAIKKAHREGRI
jgi:ribosome recycling factor